MTDKKLIGASCLNMDFETCKPADIDMTICAGYATQKCTGNYIDVKLVIAA